MKDYAVCLYMWHTSVDLKTSDSIFYLIKIKNDLKAKQQTDKVNKPVGEHRGIFRNSRAKYFLHTLVD